jgi:eukaryotic translation initiation factor 2C
MFCCFNYLLFFISRGTGSPVNGSPGVAGDKKRQKRVQQTKAFKVSLTFAARIPLKSIAMSLRGIDSPHTQDALRVLDIILRQQQANRSFLF